MAKNLRNEPEPLTPTPDYVNPGRAIYNRPHGPTYTSGTYNQALTGNYFNYRPDVGLSDSRPIGHGKGWGNGQSAAVAVTRGQLVPGAARGVGQPTIDGFAKQQRDAAVLEFIRQMVAKKAWNRPTTFKKDK